MPELKISPSSLTVTEGTTTAILLENTGDVNIIFKVKVTEKSKYVVKPNVDILEPLQTRAVAVHLHPEWKEPKEDDLKKDPKKKYDKFLVSYVEINDTTMNEFTSLRLKSETRAHRYIQDKFREIEKERGEKNLPRKKIPCLSGASVTPSVPSIPEEPEKEGEEPPTETKQSLERILENEGERNVDTRESGNSESDSTTEDLSNVKNTKENTENLEELKILHRELEDKNKKAEKRVRELEKRLESKERLIVETESRAEKADKQAKSLESKLEKAENRVRDLEKNEMALKNKADEANGKLSDSQKVVDELRERAETIEKELNEAKERAKAAEEQVEQVSSHKEEKPAPQVAVKPVAAPMNTAQMLMAILIGFLLSFAANKFLPSLA